MSCISLDCAETGVFIIYDNLAGNSSKNSRIYRKSSRQCIGNLGIYFGEIEIELIR